MKHRRLLLYILTPLLLVGGFFSVSSQVYAQVNTQQTIFDKNCALESDSEFCKQVASEKSQGNRVLGPNGIVTRAISIFVIITGAVSVIMIIIGGFRYVLSAGDSNAISGAKNTILYAVVGLVVAIFSQMIVTFVLSKL